jgi:DNA invertase Pin-like site-specific DNA recombinase
MMPQPRTIPMEATIFTGWIYDHLLPYAENVKVAHPLNGVLLRSTYESNIDETPAGQLALTIFGAINQFFSDSHAERQRDRSLQHANLRRRKRKLIEIRTGGELTRDEFEQANADFAKRIFELEEKQRILVSKATTVESFLTYANYGWWIFRRLGRRPGQNSGASSKFAIS